MEYADTRVKYTKAVLKTALLALLKEKPLNRVTVKEICDAAKLNRGTFYLHYSSPYELLKEIENDFVEENLAFFSPYIEAGVGNHDLNQLEGMFRCIMGSPEICRILMGPNGDPQFMLSLHDLVKERVLDEWQKELSQYSRQELSFVFEFVFPGASNLILRWLEDSSGISAEELALRLDRLGAYCQRAIGEFSGRKQPEEAGKKGGKR